MDENALRDLRRRIDLGEAVSNEEILAGIDAIRGIRFNLAASSKTPKASSTPNIGTLDLKSLLAKRNVNPGG